MKKNTNVPKIIKVNATKDQIIAVLEKLDWEIGYDSKFYYINEPVYDDSDYVIGEATIAVYPQKNSFKITVDKKDYPKGHMWEAKYDLDRYIEYLSEEILLFKQSIISH